MIRAAAICGLLAGPVFVVGWVAGGLMQPNAYSFVHDSVSDLGAEGADNAWAYNRLGGNLTGLLLLGFAVGLWTSVGSGRSARIGALLVGVVGAGQFLDGFFRLDCPEFDAGCATPDASWHGTAHGIESTFTILAFALAPFVLSRAVKLAPSWNDLWKPSLAFAIGTVAGSLVAGMFGVGLGVLVGTTIWFTWIAVLAIRMLRLAANGIPDARPTRAVRAT